MTARTVLDGCAVVTMDDEYRLVEGGAVAVEAGRIVGVLDRGALFPQAEETLDATGMLVIPGLVNSHGHVPMSLLRGLADDMKLMEWLNGLGDLDKRDDARLVVSELVGNAVRHARPLADGTMRIAWDRDDSGINIARELRRRFADGYHVLDQWRGNLAIGAHGNALRQLRVAPHKYLQCVTGTDAVIRRDAARRHRRHLSVGWIDTSGGGWWRFSRRGAGRGRSGGLAPDCCSPKNHQQGRKVERRILLLHPIRH